MTSCATAMNHFRIACIRLPHLGPIWIAAHHQGVARIALRGAHAALAEGLPAKAQFTIDEASLTPLIEQLHQFTEGTPTIFNQDLDLRGTPFQLAVWKAIAQIPWGETRSYAWVANTIGKPRAVRAVAQACGANPVPILIPCHRVIAADGTIGGFSGGVELKRTLLAIEGIHL